MHPLSALNMPAHLAGVPLVNGPLAFAQRPHLGQVGVVDQKARQNLISITTGTAMAAAGAYALLNVPAAKKVSQIALGGLGAALLLTGLLNVYDGIA